MINIEHIQIITNLKMDSQEMHGSSFVLKASHSDLHLSKEHLPKVHLQNQPLTDVSAIDYAVYL